MKILPVKTSRREQFINITDEVQREITKNGIKNGICVLSSMHTTAGLTVNENADPSVVKDMNRAFQDLVPPDAGYDHLEGNSDSHIKTSMVGPSLSLIIESKRLVLGTWQGIFFCEFDGPRSRKVAMQIVPAE